MPALESLEEISSWLGTSRDRVRQAQSEDQEGVTVVVNQLEARYVGGGEQS